MAALFIRGRTAAISRAGWFAVHKSLLANGSGRQVCPLSKCLGRTSQAAGFQSGLDVDPASSSTDWASLGESLCPVDLCVRHEIGEPREGCSWTERPLGEAPGFFQAWVFGILWPLGLGFSKCKVGVGTFLSELPQREAIDQMLQSQARGGRGLTGLQVGSISDFVRRRTGNRAASLAEWEESNGVCVWGYVCVCV